MVTLAWGNFLALILPGVTVLFAARHFEPSLRQIMGHPKHLTLPAGAALLLLAALAGGVLEATRRSTFDLWIPRLRRRIRQLRGQRPRRSPANIYKYVTPDNQATFEAAVENSYKYYTFYGNLAWGLATLIAARIYSGSCGRLDLLLALVIAVITRAAYIQHGAFSDRMIGFVLVELRRRKEVKSATE